MDSIQLRIALVRQLLLQSLAGLAGAQVSAVMLVVALWNAVPDRVLFLWIGSYAALQIPRNVLVWRFHKSNPQGPELISWGNLFSILTVASGLVWGLAGVFLFPSESLAHQYLLALFLAGISSAAAVAYSPLMQCYLPTVLAETLPISGRCFFEGDPTHLTMGVVMLVYAAVVVASGRHIHNVTVSSFRLQFERSDLIESLTEEKTRAEELNRTLMKEVEERKQAEKALRQSEERLDLALKGADLGLWDWNIVSGDIFLSPRLWEMLGYSPDEPPQQAHHWKDLIHPEDRPYVGEQLQALVEGRTSLYQTEHRRRTKTGDWKWVLSRGRVVEKDAAGSPLRATGTHLDITDRRKIEDRLRASLDEKELLLREIHHRVKNNLQIMSSLLRLQSRYVKNAEYQSMFRDTESRVASMAFVHEQLYKSGNMAQAEAYRYMTTLVNHLLGSYGMASGRIRVNKEIEQICFTAENAIPLGIIVTELVSNGLKHAFPDGKEGEINISLRAQDGGEFELAVRDNGVGIGKDVDLKEPETLGLRLVNIFAKQLHGRVTIQTGGGTEFRITFSGVKPARSGPNSQETAGTIQASPLDANSSAE